MPRETELERRLAARPVPGVPASQLGDYKAGRAADAKSTALSREGAHLRVHHVIPTTHESGAGKAWEAASSYPSTNHRLLHGAQRGPAHRRTLTASAASATPPPPHPWWRGKREGPPFVGYERGASWHHRDTARPLPNYLPGSRSP